MKIFHTLIALLLQAGIYSFVNLPLAPDAKPSAVIPTYKTETAALVFNQLKRAQGLLSSEKPALFLVKRLPNPRFVMAMISYDKGVIYIEEAAYDLCISFGADSLNALSVYLGHELAHFFGRHNVTNHYAWEYEQGLRQDSLFKILEKSLPESKRDSLMDIINKSMRAFTSAENEKDADLQGGFLSYLSGYQTFGIAGRLLDKTYDDFGLPKNPPNYPSLEKRKQIAADTEKKLSKLIDHFEMGNFLVALEEYDDALLYYHKVLANFKSREIYNNIGVLYTLSFLKKANKKKVKYAFPVELDAESRLLTSSSKGNEDNEIQKLYLAIDNFEKASALDDDYPIAHLNKGCAQALLGLHAEDEDLATEAYAVATAEAMIAKRLAKMNTGLWKKTLIDAFTLNGIIEALKGNKENANLAFKEALKISPDNHLAETNHAILNDIKKDKTGDLSLKGNAEKETIDGIEIDKIKIGREDVRDTLDPARNNFTRLIFKRLDHSRLMINHVKESSKERYATFHLTDANYVGTTAKGIRINASLTDIKTKYGEPDTYFELGQGTWLIYKKSKIIFQLDADGRLVRWSVYNHVI